MATNSEQTQSRPVAERLADVAHSNIDKAAEAGTAAEEKARIAAQEASVKAQAAADKARSTGEEAATQAKHAITENPLMAAGAAFMVGFVVSSLLRR